jgi:hypothetical protein
MNLYILNIIFAILTLSLFAKNFIKKQKNIVDFDAMAILSFGLIAIISIKAICHVPLPKYPNTFATPSGHTATTIFLIFGSCYSFSGLFNICQHKFYRYFFTILFGLYQAYYVVHAGYHEIDHAVFAFIMAMFVCVILDMHAFKSIKRFHLLIANIVILYISYFSISHYFPNYSITSGMLTVAILNVLMSISLIRATYLKNFHI